jgi:peptidoglycan/LPS O-acetylase OafA/YrhL
MVTPHVGVPSRYRSLDLWRGIACLSVIVYHAGMTDRGWAKTLTEPLHHGVTLFFVISGYCIAAAASRSTGGLDYFWRRLRRILPPYWAMMAGAVLFMLILGWLGLAHYMTETEISEMDRFPEPSWLNAWQWLGNLTLTESWRHLLIWKGGTRYFAGHSWTLMYEEQFYVVMGVLLLLRIRLGAGVLVVTAFVAALARFAPPGPFFDGYWLLFAAGTAVFYWRNASPWFTAPTLIGLAGLAHFARPGLTVEFLIGGTFAGLLYVLRPWDDQLIEIAPDWLYACGLRCYSIYLVHYPLTRFLAHSLAGHGPWFAMLVITPISLTISLAVAWPFHAYVERRFMSTRQRHVENAAERARDVAVAEPAA